VLTAPMVAADSSRSSRCLVTATFVGMVMH
jgi:hypothetical protein